MTYNGHMFSEVRFGKLQTPVMCILGGQSQSWSLTDRWRTMRNESEWHIRRDDQSEALLQLRL